MTGTMKNMPARGKGLAGGRPAQLKKKCKMAQLRKVPRGQISVGKWGICGPKNCVQRR